MLAVLLCCLTSAATALQVTDDRGVTVTLPGVPQRIVSLLPSLTETVCELGYCNRLVGVDRYSTFPRNCRSCRRWGAGWTRTSR